jgi:diguanylate cyclase (GGDEF)-like protein
MRSSLRESDFVGRYGGEEFLILLPDTGKQQARLVAEKVRTAVEAIYLPTSIRGSRPARAWPACPRTVATPTR